MSKGAICPNGHRSGAPIGGRCGAKLKHQALCQERVIPEPRVRTCERCGKGIYVEGHCTFCGHVDPETSVPTPLEGPEGRETREEAHVGQEETSASERGLSGAVCPLGEGT